ncbi:MAG TPA: DinB family protein [Chthonomonadaceae bacterium]|nr:DinB family protein [Chthonomonadaceae bacterium]
MVEVYLELLEQGYYEVKFAFEGLADTNVWKRPAAGLLSVGELAGHLAYWEAIRLAGEGEDLEKCRVQSPLIDNRFRYYPKTLATAPSEQHLAMTAEQVCAELLRAHEESVAHFKALSPDPGACIPGDPTGFTYGGYLKYAGFHIAYHTGQMYSVRHLLGEETPDN